MPARTAARGNLLERKPAETIEKKIVALYVSQLKEDDIALTAATAERRTPKLTLAAKYAPREKMHYDKSVKAAKPGRRA